MDSVIIDLSMTLSTEKPKLVLQTNSEGKKMLYWIMPTQFDEDKVTISIGAADGA